MSKKPESSNKIKFQIPRIFLLFNIISIAIIVVAFFYLIAHSHIRRFRSEKEQLSKELLEEKKDLIQKEVDKAVRFVNFTIENSDEALEETLKERVENAYRIANNIYEQNRHALGKEEIINRIKEALRPVRYDNGRGYIFLVSYDGYDILYPVAPELEGVSLLGLKDDAGNPVLKNEIELAKTKGKGFVKGYWQMPEADSSKIFEKLSYIIALPELNCYIGSGEYLKVFEQKKKQEALQWLTELRFGKEGYIFVNTYQGDALLTDGKLVEPPKNIWHLEDPNGVKVIQEERNAVKNPDGDFIFYQWRKLNSEEIAPKVSFIKGVDKWQWMIGAGVYIDDIATTLAKHEEEIKTDLKRDALLMALTIAILAAILFVFSIIYTRQLRQNVSSFLRFFEQAHRNYQPIKFDRIHFNEFKRIAKAANDLICKFKQSEEKQKSEALYFECLFEAAPEAISLVDKDFRIKRINNRFQDLFGYSSEECINKQIDKLIIPDNTQSKIEKINEQLLEGKEVYFEDFRKTKSGKLIQVAIHATPIIFPNKEVKNYVIYRDITQQKQFEEELDTARRKAEESDRLKSAFLANISHEIRTPMNAILGFSSLLTNESTPPKTREEYVKIINQSGSNLIAIIDDILDFAKLEAESFSIYQKSVDLHLLFQGLHTNMKQQLQTEEKDQIKLDFQPASSPKEIVSDPKRLKQVLENLTSNAIKFSSQGTIEVGYKHYNNNQLLFYVKDEGIGIEQNKLLHIFDRFRQLDDNTTRRYGGIGIGLSISKRIVELMGGHIWVDSAPQVGSAFYFTLPIVTSDKREELTPTAQTHYYWPGKTILIAEDNLMNFEYLQSALAPTHSTIIWAKNGKEAIQKVQSVNVDLLLMDINMPLLDGNKALKVIRETHPNLPVIAQTAYALDDEIMEIKSIGYDDLLIKPIGIKELIHKIAVFMD